MEVRVSRKFFAVRSLEEGKHAVNKFNKGRTSYPDPIQKSTSRSRKTSAATYMDYLQLVLVIE